MKKILLLSLISTLAWGQKPRFDINAKLDSLRILVLKNKTEDTTAVYQLAEWAQICFHQNMFLEGFLAAQKIREISKKIGFKAGTGIYLKALNTVVDNGLKPHYFSSKWFFTDNNLTYIPPKLRLFKYQEDDPKLIISELKKTAEYFKKNIDEEILGVTYLQLSNYHLKISDWANCVKYADKTILLHENKPSESILVYTALIYKMFALSKWNKSKEAKATEIQANIMVSKSTDNREIAVMSDFMAEKYQAENRIALAIEYFSKSEKAFEASGDKESRIPILMKLANMYGSLEMNKKAAEYYIKEIKLCEETHTLNDIGNAYFQLGFRLIDLKNFVNGRRYIEKGYQVFMKGNDHQKQIAMAKVYDADGQILMAKGLFKEAIPLFELSVNKYMNGKGPSNFSYYIDYYLANCYNQLGNYSKSIEYGLRSYKKLGFDITFLPSLCLILSDDYKKMGNIEAAFKYLDQHTEIIKRKEKENLANNLADLEIKEVVRKAELEKQNIESEKRKESEIQRTWIGGISLALIGAFVFMYFLSNTIKNKQKANLKLEDTLKQLQSTQVQLIQSEKLASLGELTAGIAHEIQNPLNFVNNFSELSVDLAKDLNEEIKNSPLTPDGGIIIKDKEYFEEIISDLTQNQEKINLHGKRASSIVKGMLEHSRASTGVKELIDINKLADEYLRLSYHGLRAKDSSFDADFKTDFEPNLPKVKVVPQDFGRVLLNLFNNAFYAVSESSTSLSHRNEYSPKVIISTRRLSEAEVEIRVTDNGTGMSEATKVKVFQPFFTTKPTGQGTGLGLSLAYDIVTKGHGGTITCESTIGKGTEFLVTLPIV